jgi:hypothetical protein
VTPCRWLHSKGAAALDNEPVSVQCNNSLVGSMQKWGINEFSEQPDRLNAVTGQYAAACRQVAASEGVPVLDLWTGGPLPFAADHFTLQQCCTVDYAGR